MTNFRPDPVTCVFSVTYTTANGWMTGDTFLDFCKKFLNKPKTLVIIDLFAAHRCTLKFAKKTGFSVPPEMSGC